MKKKSVFVLTATAAVVASLLGAAPAMADSARSGTINCNPTNYVRVVSQTSGTGSFAVAHGIGGVAVAWSTPGYHAWLFNTASGTWVVNTSGTILSAGASCVRA